MKLVSVRSDLFTLFQNDTEILWKSTRPYVLVLRLNYKGHNYNFAIPIRSNIPAASPKNHYFALPPRANTKPHNRHGLHYIKMFPITKDYISSYRTAGNTSAFLIQSIINRNQKRIVTECQTYLNQYADGLHPKYSTDIDYLLSVLFPSSD